MATQYLWRVQSRGGSGPYRPKDKDKSFSREAWKPILEMMFGDHYAPSHPCPYSDFTEYIYKPGFRGLFGFQTRRQAREWFDEYLPLLESAGFFLVRVPALRGSVVSSRSRKQAIFKARA